MSCGGAAHWNCAAELAPALCGSARGTTLVAALRGGGGAAARGGIARMELPALRDGVARIRCAAALTASPGGAARRHRRRRCAPAQFGGP